MISRLLLATTLMRDVMLELTRIFGRLKTCYDRKQECTELLINLTNHTLDLLSSNEISTTDYRHSVKRYYVYSRQGNITRPVMDVFFIKSKAEFEYSFRNMIGSLLADQCRYNTPSEQINRIVYTIVMSFACCYDLFSPKSRKTPGTQFEVVMGVLLSLILPNFTRDKQIQIPNAEEKITTDIVFDNVQQGVGFAIPVKITTRERIVQPFAHQRIMDNVFGVGRYKSLFIGMSETKRDNDNLKVDEICVPGTIKLFSEHMASLSGMYYLDPPSRYLAEDLTAVVSVKTVGDLLSGELGRLIMVR